MSAFMHCIAMLSVGVQSAVQAVDADARVLYVFTIYEES